MSGPQPKPGEVVGINQEYFRDKAGSKLVEESPHLNHPTVRIFCDRLTMDVFHRAQAKHPQPVILDMGAGDGALTLPYLKLGARVTAADATNELLSALAAKATAQASALRIMPGDIFASLDILRRENQKFDIICASSFFHHIPDYEKLCRDSLLLLAPDGIFFSMQDPLRYDSLSRWTFFIDRMTYFWWRLFQGNYFRGIKTRVRRLFGVYRENLAEDSAEYHVVRNGVDQIGLKELFEKAGYVCTIHPYWSTQSAFGQKVGESLKLSNTFALIAQRKA